jgi:hypothetical protein
MGRIWKSPFVDIGVETGAYAIGDALGSRNSFNAVPEHGYLVGVVVQDHDQENPIFDIAFFDIGDIAGTTDNSAFAPTDAELANAMGVVRVADYATFNTNALGQAHDFRMPYWARDGTIDFQCMIRAVHTFTATTDIQIAIYVELN